MTLVDTNVLIDALGAETQWRQPSLRAIAAAQSRGAIVINPVIFAELSIGYPDARSTEAELAIFDIDMRELTPAALHRAGRAFLAYRRQGGVRTGVLPDFFIGAQAEVEGLPLLTRDPARYRIYFPDVAIIEP